MTAQPVYTTGSSLELYCQHLANLGRAASTISNYRMILAKAEEELGRSLLEAGPAELRRLHTMSPRIQALALAPKAKYAGVVVAYLEWAVDEELLGQAPVGPLRKWVDGLASPRPPEVTFLAMAEVERLAQAFWQHSRHPERDAAILWVMAGAGGRITETLQLRRNDVSLTDQVIRFRHHTKGRKRRDVPMVPQAREALRVWVKARVTPSDWLFVGWDHRPLNRVSFEWKLHRVSMLVDPPIQWSVCPEHGERACDPGRGPDQCRRAHWRVHPHTLRHSFAVEALRSGACSLVQLRDLLGHNSIATTNIYANVAGDTSADNRFKRRFGKG